MRAQQPDRVKPGLTGRASRFSCRTFRSFFGIGFFHLPEESVVVVDPVVRLHESPVIILGTSDPLAVLPIGITVNSFFFATCGLAPSLDFVVDDLSQPRSICIKSRIARRRACSNMSCDEFRMRRQCKRRQSPRMIRDQTDHAVADGIGGRRCDLGRWGQHERGDDTKATDTRRKDPCSRKRSTGQRTD